MLLETVLLALSVCSVRSQLCESFAVVSFSYFFFVCLFCGSFEHWFRDKQAQDQNFRHGSLWHRDDVWYNGNFYKLKLQRSGSLEHTNNWSGKTEKRKKKTKQNKSKTNKPKQKNIHTHKTRCLCDAGQKGEGDNPWAQVTATKFCEKQSQVLLCYTTRVRQLEFTMTVTYQADPNVFVWSLFAVCVFYVQAFGQRWFLGVRPSSQILRFDVLVSSA